MRVSKRFRLSLRPILSESPPSQAPPPALTNSPESSGPEAFPWSLGAYILPFVPRKPLSTPMPSSPATQKRVGPNCFVILQGGGWSDAIVRTPTLTWEGDLYPVVICWTSPTPLHETHSFTFVPGSAPTPWHLEHTFSLESDIFSSRALSVASRGISSSTSISLPRFTSSFLPP